MNINIAFILVLITNTKFIKSIINFLALKTLHIYENSVFFISVITNYLIKILFIILILFFSWFLY